MQSNISPSRRRPLSYLAITLLALALAMVLGKDFNWDQLAYHYYAGWSVVENRFASDYFAGSSQSYFNPYAHLPFYLMASRGLAPQWIVAALALFHVINLLIVYEVGVLFNRRQDGSMAWTPVYLGLFFAVANSVFLLELGNTFNEISTSVFVLAGWYVLIRGFGAPRLRWVALAGVLIGAGVALKLTNLIFSVTALPLLLLAPVGVKRRAWAVLAFALGGVAGVLLAGGWWAWQMWEMFGNPFFPLFNQFFHSPYYTDEVLRHYRFLPDTLAGILLKPFTMALPDFGIHIETPAPDLRYAAMVILLALFGIKALLRHPKVNKWMADDPFPPFQNGRALFAFGMGVLCTWLIWVFSSGNSRYFLAMSMLFSVILASMLFRFSGKHRFRFYTCLILASVQLTVVWNANEKRWTPVDWGQSWYELDLPEAVQRQPALYLHLNALPASFLTPYLAPGSGMINLTGQYVLEENDKIRALLDRHQGNVRVMRRYAAPKARYPAGEFNPALLRFGLEADMDACHTIRMRLRHRKGAPDGFLYYVACAARPLQGAVHKIEEYERKKRRVAAVFDRLEAICPRYLQPKGLALEGDGNGFYRVYGNTDMSLMMYPNGLLTLRNTFTNSESIKLGHIDAVEQALPSKQSFCFERKVAP